MIALLIGYEAITRFLAPVPIHFGEAIPIAILGLFVNIGSVFLLGGANHHHGPGHSHGHGHTHGHGHAHDDHDHHDHAHEEAQIIATAGGDVELAIFEHDVPPVFRLHHAAAAGLDPAVVTIETLRPDGARQRFALVDRGAYFESLETIPEPHAFKVEVMLGAETHGLVFDEHAHGDDHAHGAADAASVAHRDNNMRAAVIHVLADAAVSVLVIAGLCLAWAFGWLWMDPLAGMVGAGVIASWAYGLVRDTGAILLDMNPDPKLAASLRAAVEVGGDRLTDLHLWRLGPGHLGAIVAVATAEPRAASFYKSRLSRFKALSHVTVEVEPARAA
jgi:cation diffusion facilitator family transporter